MNLSIYICQEVMNKITQIQHNRTKQNKNENSTKIKNKKNKRNQKKTQKLNHCH